MRKLVVSLAVLTGLLVSASPAAAIAFGELDGNTHRNVGALIADYDPEFEGPDLLCSGTLISPTVFLTAAHCTAFLESLGISEVFVSFDADVDPVTASTQLIPGEMHTHPGFPGTGADPKDIAVVTFAAPVGGRTPARLPTAGLLAEMKAAGALRGKRFTAVGYGVQERQLGGGPPSFPFDGLRRRAVESFNSLNKSWLRLSMNPSKGDGGGCFGDSGGPNFLGTGNATVPGTVAGTTITGDSVCRATNVTYRLDTPVARNFLDEFVELP